MIVENGNIEQQEKFNDNTYNNFNFDINTIKYNFIRVGRITKFLNENAYNDMGNLLDEIEELINGRR